MKALVQILLWIFPWNARRFFLISFFGFKIDKSAKIGFSIILAKELELERKSYIGNFTLCKAIDKLHLKMSARLGTLNYITGFSSYNKNHFSHVEDRKCVLIIGNHSAVTSRHFLDATGGIYIGNFTTFAGIKSQILTHSIDLQANRQDADSVFIGDYCFVGTGCILLKGAKLPHRSVLGAMSLLNKNHDKENCLYGGVPAKFVSEINVGENDYFKREVGFVK